MDYRKALPPSGPIRQAALCVLLMAFAVGLVFGTTALMEKREPYVDLSQRAHVVSARDSSRGGSRLRFAVATIVSPEPTFAIYRRLVRRIARDVGYEDVFVMRPSYEAVRRALEKGEVDVALVCTGPYVHALPSKRVELLVQPEFVEGVTYRAELIVPADSEARRSRT